jgi:hypothetical protein
MGLMSWITNLRGRNYCFALYLVQTREADLTEARSKDYGD